MTDTIRTARDDLAFMKAVAEDRGPLPAQFGAHLLAIGLIYGANLILAWALFAGRAPWWPHDPWLLGTWVPGTILYLPAVILISLSGPKTGVGPTGRVFIAAWQAMALMIWATIAVMVTASVRARVPYYEVWPPMAFVLYGGAWSVVGVIRRRLWHGLVALGCFATAVTAAALVKSPETWLVMSAGLFLFLAGPGAAIMLRAGRPA